MAAYNEYSFSAAAYSDNLRSALIKMVIYSHNHWWTGESLEDHTILYGSNCVFFPAHVQYESFPVSLLILFCF